MSAVNQLLREERLPLIVVEIQVRDQLARQVGREELVPEFEQRSHDVLEKVWCGKGMKSNRLKRSS